MSESRDHVVGLWGMVVYALLFGFALMFYLERTVFTDIAFHLFYILKDQDFAIQNYRFGAVLTQVFPLAASHLGVGLKGVMLCYSSGFVLYNLSIFVVCKWVLRSDKFAWAILLFNTLMVSHTFYWIQSELQQGLGMLVLYFALVSSIEDPSNGKSGLSELFLYILSFFLVFFHPLIIFPFAFGLGFMYLEKYERQIFFLRQWIFFLCVFLIKLLFFGTAYDSTSFGGLRNLWRLFPNYFTLPSNSNFISYLISDYYLLVLVFFAMMTLYVKKGKWIQWLWTGGFFVGYTFLVNVAYPQGADQYYMENLYLPLSIFVILPLVTDLPRFLGVKKTHYVFVAFALVSLLRIWHTHVEYTERVSYLRKVLLSTENAESRKLLIKEDVMDMDTLMTSWATPYEFWLLSTCEGGDSRSLLISDAPEPLFGALDNKHVFITKWGIFDYGDFPKQYFRWTDTSRYIYVDRPLK